MDTTCRAINAGFAQYVTVVVPRFTLPACSNFDTDAIL